MRHGVRFLLLLALANDRLVILADEPTGSLDNTNNAIVFDIFERLAQAILNHAHWEDAL